MAASSYSTTKRCTSCETEKSIEDFSPQRMRGKVYRNSRCKQCMNRIDREKRAANLTVNHPKRVFWDEHSCQMVKECRKCAEVKPVAAFIIVNTIGTLHTTCRICHAAEQREQYWASPELQRERVKEWSERHPAQVKARKKRWVASNRKKVNASDLRHYYRHRDTILALARTPEKSTHKKAWRRAWAKANRKNTEYRDRRRAREKNAPRIEAVDRLAVVQRDKSTCYLCLRLLNSDQIALDHVIPLSRGGSHTADNLRVACRSCNSRKGTKLLSELPWYNPPGA